MSHQQPITERRIRFALIGCGRIALNHIVSLEQHADRVLPKPIDSRQLCELLVRSGTNEQPLIVQAG